MTIQRSTQHLVGALVRVALPPGTKRGAAPCAGSSTRSWPVRPVPIYRREAARAQADARRPALGTAERLGKPDAAGF
ncbi:MAG: hypothetical protein ABI699_09620 [Caldimonas sp.]